jgi:trans-2,3-dihydro-3-hydroxyanthranilate isomerase
MLDLKIGPTKVDLEWHESRMLQFAWMNQRVPEFGAPLPEPLRAPLAGALSVTASDLLPLPVQTASSGVPFLYVPMVSEEAVDRASADRAKLADIFARAGEAVSRPVFVFAMSSRPHVTCYSRMFAPEFGIPEDPATGGASGPLGVYLLRHGLVSREQALDLVSLQGVKMQRPSRIAISVATDDGGAVRLVRVGGQAVLVGAGEIRNTW